MDMPDMQLHATSMYATCMHACNCMQPGTESMTASIKFIVMLPLRQDAGPGFDPPGLRGVNAREVRRKRVILGA